MEIESLKKKMMRLWKKTFHDSDQYISLIFENYFDEKWIEYEEKDGELVASLLGIPYSLSGYSINSEDVKILYLCGLATEENFRNSGIMTRLLERINEKTKNENILFTFLIPADEGLQKYYFDRGYVKSFYRNLIEYTSIHNFRNELKSIDSNAVGYYDDYIVNDYEEIEKEVQEKVKNYIRGKEKHDDIFTVGHSEKDLEIVICENQLNGGRLGVILDENEEINATAFYETDSDGRVKISYLMYDSIAAKYRILSYIKDENIGKDLYYYEPTPYFKKREAVYDNYYIGGLHDNLHYVGAQEKEVIAATSAISYGMIKFINIDILKKIIGNPDFDWKKIVKSDEKSYQDFLSSWKDYDMQQLSSILLRNASDEDVYSRSLGMSVLHFRMGMMLD